MASNYSGLSDGISPPHTPLPSHTHTHSHIHTPSNNQNTQIVAMTENISPDTRRGKVRASRHVRKPAVQHVMDKANNYD